jgi:1-acyl-sn-glycerol-3-phosphate acyltransferase
VALLALRAGAPVVPAGIRGTYEALTGRRMYVPRRRPLAVRFGAPRRFALDRSGGRAARDQVTRRIMDDIAALLA